MLNAEVTSLTGRKMQHLYRGLTAYDLSNLIKWLDREDWQPLLEEVMAEHFGPAMEAFDVEFEEIDEALGGNWGTTLWGCAFKDFLTRRFEPDERNPVEAYLRHRGWKESAAARRYMTALQSSVMSLYEVSDLTPGQSLRARDLIRGGEPVLVSERSQTADAIATGEMRPASMGLVLCVSKPGTGRTCCEPSVARRSVASRKYDCSSAT